MARDLRKDITFKKVSETMALNGYSAIVS